MGLGWVGIRQSELGSAATGPPLTLAFLARPAEAVSFSFVHVCFCECGVCERVCAC